MSLGKSAVGALVGSAVGLAVQLGVELNTGEAPWCALVTGLATGLGVRQFDPSVGMTASYLRGALAALFALGSTFAGVVISSNQMVAQHASAIGAPAVISPANAGAAPTDGAAAEDEAKGATEPPPPPTPPADTPAIDLTPSPSHSKTLVSNRFSAMSFAMIAIGALLAYEFARGKQSGSASDPSAGADEGPDASDGSAGDEGHETDDRPADA